MREIAGRYDLREEEAWALAMDYLAAQALATAAPDGDGALTGAGTGSFSAPDSRSS